MLRHSFFTPSFSHYHFTSISVSFLSITTPSIHSLIRRDRLLSSLKQSRSPCNILRAAIEISVLITPLHSSYIYILSQSGLSHYSHSYLQLMLPLLNQNLLFVSLRPSNTHAFLPPTQKLPYSNHNFICCVPVAHLSSLGTCISLTLNYIIH
jgi:hypothetical protein